MSRPSELEQFLLEQVEEATHDSAGQITLFESQGMAIQDLAVAIRVLAAAEAAGVGRKMPME